MSFCTNGITNIAKVKYSGSERGLNDGVLEAWCIHRVKQKIVEARAGIEPAHDGFADRSVTASPPCQMGTCTEYLVLAIL